MALSVRNADVDSRIILCLCMRAIDTQTRVLWDRWAVSVCSRRFAIIMRRPSRMFAQQPLVVCCHRRRLTCLNNGTCPVSSKIITRQTTQAKPFLASRLGDNSLTTQDAIYCLIVKIHILLIRSVNYALTSNRSRFSVTFSYASFIFPSAI